MPRHRIFLTSLLLLAPLSAEPLADGTYVDFIVVPVGPVPLATFERVKPAAPTATAPAAKPGQPTAKPGPAGQPAPPAGDGGGIRVKDVDPTELPPTAVFVRKSASASYQIPCNLNAVGVPVRTPVKDSVVTLLVRSATDGSLIELGKIVLPKTNQPLLVLLTKPLGEKKWTRPTLTVFAVGGPAAPGIVFVNASQAMGCGINVGGKAQLLAGLKQLVWQAPPPPAPAEPEVILAMRHPGGDYLAPFFNTSLPLEPGSSLLLISYEVTEQESFRCGKCITGTLTRTDFRPAELYPPQPDKPRANAAK